MCSPLAVGVGSLVLGAASAVSGYMGQQAQARSQTAYAQAQADAWAKSVDWNNKAAAQEYTEQAAAARISQMQEREAASAKVQEQQTARLRAQGTMLASSNAAGVALDMLRGDYERQEAVNRQRIRDAYLNSSVNTEISLANYRQRAVNHINSQQDFVSMSGGSWGSGLGLALGLGAAGLNAWEKYDKLNTLIGDEPTGGGGNRKK